MGLNRHYDLSVVCRFYDHLIIDLGNIKRGFDSRLILDGFVKFRSFYGQKTNGLGTQKFGFE
jgi:hypothetical protein